MHPQTVSGFWLKGILAAAQAQSISEAQVLTKAGVAQLPSSANDRVALDATVNIWNAAIELTNDPLFGFHMGRQFRPGWFHLIHHLWSNSPNVLSAIKTALKYQTLISDGGDLTLSLSDDKVIIGYHTKEARLPFSYHQIDAVLTILVSLMRWSIDEDFSPLELIIPHDTSAKSNEYLSFFNCTITTPTTTHQTQSNKQHQSGKQTQLIFHKDWLTKPMLGADPDLLTMHIKLADQKLAELGRSSLIAQITSLLNTQGQFNNLSKEEMAKRLDTSSRTLQRRLEQEGTSYKALSDEIRKHMAESFIEQGLTTNEMLQKLSFKEVSSLHKACKRWFGMSLQQRRELCPN